MNEPERVTPVVPDVRLVKIVRTTSRLGETIALWPEWRIVGTQEFSGGKVVVLIEMPA